MKKRGHSMIVEKQLKVKIETWAHLAHLWGTYETILGDDPKVGDRGINSIQAVYDGKQFGTCMVGIPAVVPRKTLFALRKEGTLELYLERWRPNPGLDLSKEQGQAREIFLAGIGEICGITAQELLDKMTYRLFPQEKWLPRRDQLLELIKKIASPAPFEK